MLRGCGRSMSTSKRHQYEKSSSILINSLTFDRKKLLLKTKVKMKMTVRQRTKTRIGEQPSSVYIELDDIFCSKLSVNAILSGQVEAGRGQTPASKRKKLLRSQMEQNLAVDNSNSPAYKLISHLFACLDQAAVPTSGNEQASQHAAGLTTLQGFKAGQALGLMASWRRYFMVLRSLSCLFVLI